MQLGIHSGTGVLSRIWIRKCLGELVENTEEYCEESPDKARDRDTLLILLSRWNWSAASWRTVEDGEPSKVSIMKSETLGRS